MFECSRCRRMLTASRSRSLGIGPVCETKAKNNSFSSNGLEYQVMDGVRKGAIIYAASVLIPSIVPAIKLIDVANMTINYSNTYNKEGSKGVITKITKDVGKNIISQSISNAFDNDINKFMTISSNSDVISNISKNIGVKPKFLYLMLESSIRGGISGGIDSIADLTIKEVLSGK